MPISIQTNLKELIENIELWNVHHHFGLKFQGYNQNAAVWLTGDFLIKAHKYSSNEIYLQIEPYKLLEYEIQNHKSTFESSNKLVSSQLYYQLYQPIRPPSITELEKLIFKFWEHKIIPDSLNLFIALSLQRDLYATESSLKQFILHDYPNISTDELKSKYNIFKKNLQTADMENYRSIIEKAIPTESLTPEQAAKAFLDQYSLLI